MNRKPNAYRTCGLRYTAVRHITLWYALLAMLLAGCQKETVREQPSGSVIQVYTDIESSAAGSHVGPGTRSVVTQGTGLTDARFLKKDGASVPSNFSGVTPLAGNIAATSGAVAFTGAPPQYTLNNQNAYMVGYYPAGSLASNVVTWTVDGKTDILLTPVWDAGKYTAPSMGATGTKMTFKHRLAQLEVVCKADPSADITALRGVWGNITSVELLQTPTQMTYSYANNTVAAAAAKADKSLLKADYSTAFAAIPIPANNNAAVNAAGMYAPSTGVFNIRVKTAAVPAGITLTVQLKDGSTNADFTVGKRHTVTLTFKINDRQIDVAASTIKGWETGKIGNDDVTI